MVFKKGNIPWILGKKHSEETKKKMSDNYKHHVPKYAYKKGSIPWITGKGHSEESKIKMSLAHKGQPSGMKGKKHTEESNKKNRLAHLGNKASNETKNKMSIKAKERWENPEYRKKILGKRDISSLEQKMIGIIEKNNLPYRFVGNGDFFIERKCPDFINVNGEKIAIEVFYRGHKEQFRGGLNKWKKNREKIFNKYGWKLLFFNEIQVNEENIRRRLKSR